jgi:hypothetical protein
MCVSICVRYARSSLLLLSQKFDINIYQWSLTKTFRLLTGQKTLISLCSFKTFSSIFIQTTQNKIWVHIAFCNVTELKNIKGKLREHGNVGWYTSTYNIVDTNHCVITVGKHTSMWQYLHFIFSVCTGNVIFMLVVCIIRGYY